MNTEKRQNNLANNLIRAEEECYKNLIKASEECYEKLNEIEKEFYQDKINEESHKDKEEKSSLKRRKEAYRRIMQYKTYRNIIQCEKRILHLYELKKQIITRLEKLSKNDPGFLVDIESLKTTLRICSNEMIRNMF